MPIDFVGIAIWDDAGDISRFVEESGIPYPIVVDINGQIAIEYGVKGIPEKFFIDPSGTLIKRYNGPMDATTLRSVLDELLAHPANEG
jgi:cytochrome c biogenesis protein CcmG/thiol:disulfide interchange protein DsbE